MSVSIRLDLAGGATIGEVFTHAHRVATLLQLMVTFVFNGVQVLVTEQSEFEETYQQYKQALRELQPGSGT